MKISKRLKKIAEQVPKNSIVADIGSDHAILPAYLLEMKITNKVIASDINESPMKLAKKKFPNIEYRIGDGLENIKEEEIDTIIISGMGGETIIKILKDSKSKKANTIIISPNKDSYYVRKYLIKQGFYITTEEQVLDKNHIYDIIVFKKGKSKYSHKKLWLGPIILRNKTELFYKKYNKELNKLISIYKSIPFSIKKVIIKVKINILKKELKRSR